MLFLLQPTNQLVEWISGMQSIHIKESGFFYREINVVLDKSCSGYNYWLLTYILFCHLTIQYQKIRKKKILFLLAHFFFTYLITIAVNSSRIIVSMVIQNKTNMLVDKSKGMVIHQSIGIITYLSFLIITYYIYERHLKNRIIHENLP